MKLASSIRRQLRVVLCASLAVTAAATTATPALQLENEFYVVEVEREHGLISRIRDKQGGFELLPEPRLADNFKFTLPLRKQYAWQSTEANYVLGREQRLTSAKVSDAELVLTWGPHLRTVLGKRYRVSVTMTIQLAGPDIRFAFRIHNRSSLEVGEVFYPILGGSLGLGQGAEARKQTELVLPGVRDPRKAAIYQNFANFSWLGVFGPEQYYSYPDAISMPWMELEQPALKRAVYFGAHDPVARCKVVHLEMSPGIALNRPESNWPRPEELDGAPAGVKMCFVQFPYQPADQDFEAAPVVLRCHEGGWRQGAAIYREWLQSQADLRPARSDWIYRAAAIQQCDHVPFKDLPARGKQAKAAGVNGLLLTRWTSDGDNSGVPHFAPDPKLGSAGDLAEALDECHKLGLKVAAVVRLSAVSTFSEMYKTTLHAFTCRDRWGIDYSTPTFGGGSPVTGGYGAGERRVWLNPGHPGMRKFLVEQMRSLAALGLDGIELHEFFGRPLDFNPGVGKTPDRASWEGGLECIQAIVQACRTVRPGFAVSLDQAWDRMLPLTQACSTEARETWPIRVSFPSLEPCFTVATEDDVAVINRTLCYGGRLRIATADGRAVGGAGTSGIAGYLKAVLALRAALSDALLDGEAAGPEMLRVDRPVTRNVFRNRATGLRTAVVLNPGSQALPLECAGFTDSAGNSARLWLPTRGTTNVSFPVHVQIPPRQAAVVTEEKLPEGLPIAPEFADVGRNARLVFDLASAEDLEGWTLTGNAFSVCSVGTLVPRPTLNSLGPAGESATGAALSPAFTVEPAFERMEVVFQGGWNEGADGEENLVLRVLDANTGATLEQLLPPGTHELTTRSIALDRLRGKTVRLQLLDNNTNGSYAWIGLRKVVLLANSGSKASP